MTECKSDGNLMLTYSFKTQNLCPQTVRVNEDPFHIIEHIGDSVMNRTHSINLPNYFSDDDNVPDFEDFEELHHPCDDEFRINIIPLLDLREENEENEIPVYEISENDYVPLAANMNDFNDDYESDWNDIDYENETDIEFEIIIEYEDDELNDL